MAYKWGVILTTYCILTGMIHQVAPVHGLRSLDQENKKEVQGSHEIFDPFFGESKKQQMYGIFFSGISLKQMQLFGLC